MHIAVWHCVRRTRTSYVVYRFERKPSSFLCTYQLRNSNVLCCAAVFHCTNNGSHSTALLLKKLHAPFLQVSAIKETLLYSVYGKFRYFSQLTWLQLPPLIVNKSNYKHFVVSNFVLFPFTSLSSHFIHCISLRLLSESMANEMAKVSGATFTMFCKIKRQIHNVFLFRLIRKTS